MFTVISIMLLSMGVGFLLRSYTLSFIHSVITVLIWMLLFILGLEVGGNSDIVNGLHTLGLEALVVTSLSVLVSCVLAWALWRVLYRNALKADLERQKHDDEAAASVVSGLKGSLIIVSFFILGAVIGVAQIVPFDVSQTQIGFFALCALMASVGLSIGNDPQTLKSFRSLNPRLLLLPLLTIAGTLIGAYLASFLFAHRTPSDCMAVGSGMGYYSLSSIFITEYKGPELGTVALLSNIMRELITLLGAPLLVRCFGNLAPIASGGATTMDTTLPIITRYGGKDLLVISVFHGFVTDFSVPFLVTYFCSL